VSSNPHQPETDKLSNAGLKCAAPDCNYYLIVPKVEWLESWKPYFRSEHTYQFDEGRAPDITVEWDIVATCSVCEDGGSM
jgi:hypothetical protein